MTISMALERLDSITKYPSIATYHALGPKGGHSEEIRTPFPQGAAVLVTEKVDGTNARIVLAGPGLAVARGAGSAVHPGWILGSRKELLTAQNDIVRVDSLGIVRALMPTYTAVLEQAESAILGLLSETPFGVITLFGEVYGGKIGPAKQYTADAGVYGFRLFDVQHEPDVRPLLERTPAQLSAWRDRGGQRFVDEDRLQTFAQLLGADVTPRLERTFDVGDVASTHAWLKRFAETRVALTDAGEKPHARYGRSEGVVVRTLDRQTIAKLRFDDYKKSKRARR